MEKLTQCLNCGQELPHKENFCPNCGQKNHATRLTTKSFLEELFQSIFNWDARLWVTLKAAFINPGRLSKEFNQGKRRKYVRPVQFYLFCSLIYFLLLGMMAQTEGEKIDNNINEYIEQNDTLKLKGSIFFENFTIPTKAIALIPHYSKQQMDSFLIANKITPTFFNRIYIQKSMHSFIGHKSAKTQQQAASIASYGLFFMLPVLAWLLYLFFSKTYPFYIEHLVFLIYFHSIIFLVLSVRNIFRLFEISGWPDNIAYIINTIFGMIALKQFYGKSWPKTIAYTGLLLILYGIIMVSFIITIMLFSIIFA